MELCATVIPAISATDNFDKRFKAGGGASWTVYKAGLCIFSA
jgi:hypothetical protein